MNINHQSNPAPEGTRKWDTFQFIEEFEVLNFLAPEVYVKRKSDGAEGTMQFEGIPRYYYNFVPS